MVTDKRSELDAILYNYRKGTETVDKSIDSILALFAPDDECTTFYAAIMRNCDAWEPDVCWADIETAQEKAAEFDANSHIIAIHVPNRLLQPRASTVTECKAEEAK